MKAIVATRYGSPDVIRFEEIAKPSPANNEVLIKICAASVNPLDWHFMRGDPPFLRLMLGLRKPKDTRVGVDLAGRVEAVGSGVTQFKPGDAVFGSCRGAFAEYVCALEKQLALKPDALSFEAAASVPVAAITALQGLRDKGRIQTGQKVLIEGASGGVGTFAVQIAKAFGAEVSAVCSTRNVQIARSIGADHVIDYTREDFTRSGQRYDLIFASNAQHSVLDYRRALRPDGIFVMAGGGLALFSQVLTVAPLLSWMGNMKFYSYVAKINKKDMEFLKEMLESGKVVPVIDRRYPLSDTAEAIRYLEEGHAQGKVVITFPS